MTVSQPLVIESAAIDKALLIYHAIYHPLRLKIVEVIHRAGRINVSKLNRKLKEDKSQVSQQLKILHDAIILNKEREGQQVFYSVHYKQIDKIRELSTKIISVPKSTSIFTEKELKQINKRVQKPKDLPFSSNELTIIRLICEQNTNEEIGEKLKLSKRTVEEYRQRIIKKMKVKNTVGLVLYAIKNQMFKL